MTDKPLPPPVNPFKPSRIGLRLTLDGIPNATHLLGTIHVDASCTQAQVDKQIARLLQDFVYQIDPDTRMRKPTIGQTIR